MIRPQLQEDMLRYLRGRPGGTTSAQAGAELFGDVSPRQFRQSRANSTLRLLERKKLATRHPGRRYRAGTRGEQAWGVRKSYDHPEGTKPQPSHLWWATPEGNAHLERLEETARERELSEAREAALLTARESALEAARRNHSWGSKEERVKIERGLRQLGCTLAEIGDAVGLSREMVRLDLRDHDRAQLAELGLSCYRLTRQEAAGRGGPR